MAPSQAVPLSFAYSALCFTAFVDEQAQYPVAIFGAGNDPQVKERGLIWLLATSDIRKVAKSVLKLAPIWLDFFEDRYPNALHNWVDARNKLHLRWLDKMGFRFDQTKMIRGQQFIHAIRY